MSSGVSLVFTILIAHSSRTSGSRQSSPRFRRACSAAGAIDMSCSRHCIDAARANVDSLTD